MKKENSLFRCTKCGAVSSKWLGRCLQCGEWNSCEEEITPQRSSRGRTSHRAHQELKTIDAISGTNTRPIDTRMKELNRVLGGGIIPGSFVLISGEPGIGKSTLLMQLANNISRTGKTIYFSTEESLGQIKLRALRIGIGNSKTLFSDLNSVDEIVATIDREKPLLAIVDSIQNCHGEERALPGSIAQLRSAAISLMEAAKRTNSAVIISGHINKEGNIAGPKLLEHLVDATLYIQGEDRWKGRSVRAIKNRFGTINELGFFDMTSNGMSEVSDISMNVVHNYVLAPGSVLTSYVEGTRPVLTELQALVVPSKLAMPQRIVSGIDHKQVVIICAILEKYLGLKLGSHDVFFKVGGDMKLRGPAYDLGIATAILSSYLKKALPEKTLALGEINLTGLTVGVKQELIYLDEAKRLKIPQVLAAWHNKKELHNPRVIRISSVYDLLTFFDK